MKELFEMIPKEIFSTAQVYTFLAMSHPPRSTHTQRILTSASPEVPFPKTTLLFISTVPAALGTCLQPKDLTITLC